MLIERIKQLEIENQKLKLINKKNKRKLKLKIQLIKDEFKKETDLQQKYYEDKIQKLNKKKSENYL